MGAQYFLIAYNLWLYKASKNKIVGRQLKNGKTVVYWNRNWKLGLHDLHITHRNSLRIVNTDRNEWTRHKYWILHTQYKNHDIILFYCISLEYYLF